MPLLNILIIVRPRPDIDDSSAAASYGAARFGAACSSTASYRAARFGAACSSAASSGDLLLAAFLHGGRPKLGIVDVTILMVRHPLMASSQCALARKALPQKPTSQDG